MGFRGLLCAAFAAAPFAAAQAGAPARPAEALVWTAPDLQGFFDALKDARSAAEARRIESEIALILARSNSPTIDLLLDRANYAELAGNFDGARELLNQSVALAPDFAEAWRRRGDIAAKGRDYAQAIADLSEAVKLQPMHFLALQSLGKLHEDGRDREAAISAYQEALALDPWLEGAQAGLRRLGADMQAGGSDKPSASAKAARAAAPKDGV